MVIIYKKMDRIFTRIIVDNDAFRVYGEFENNSLIILLLGNNVIWNCNATETDLRKYAQDHQLSFNEYYSQLRKYLHMPTDEVSFNIKDEQFIIYRNLKVGRLKFFFKDLQKANYIDSIDDILNNFYIRKVEISQRLSSLEKENQELEKVKTEYELKFKEFIEKKKADDEQLYGNFVQVLNEKKKRIQHLNDLLETFREGRSTINPTLKVKRKKHNKEEPVKNKRKQKEVISETEQESVSSDSESDKAEEYETDNEENPPVDYEDFTALVDEETRVKPSTSKQTYSFLIDDDSPKIQQLLPKRNKKSNNETTGCPRNLVIVEGSDHEETVAGPTPTEPNKNKAVDFNTQDLLDLYS